MVKPIPLRIGRRFCFSAAAAFFTFFFISHSAAQQCPRIVNCPQTTITYCDATSNDSSFWNVAPFTFSPTIGISDVHEGPIDLNIKGVGCVNGGLISISYVLFLDLDNDDTQETVLRSNALPPAGIVLVNNLYNPGYMGGDTMQFDRHNLPDSMLFRFSLEIDYSGDTTTGWVRWNTPASPYDFVQPHLPEGRHRIEWRIEQDGVARTCERSFKVKDCKKPTPVCKNTLMVFLDEFQSATVNLSDVMIDATDNVTLDSQLILGIRRLGTGFGFPVDSLDQPQTTADFNCQTNENQAIEFWAQDRVFNEAFCTTNIIVADTNGICPFTAPPAICARTYWNGDTILQTAFGVTWNYPTLPPQTNFLALDDKGCATLDFLPPTSHFSLAATKDTNILNGITTYDLVLISKHILGTQPFTEGWMIKAADVNNSGTVTTFDIVELRKLILGVSGDLPNNTPSWRFYVDSCSVWGTPFYGYCPSGYTLPVQPLGAYPPHLLFKGLKMGDVNGSASPDSAMAIAQTRGEPLLLELPTASLKAGETLQIPIRVASAGAWEGLQMSLKIDPALMEIEKIEPGDALPNLDENSWARPGAGLLNISWAAAEAATVLPGAVLLWVQARALKPVQISSAFGLDRHGLLQPEAYDENGEAHPVQLVFCENYCAALTEETAGFFAPSPNPTTTGARLPLRLSSPQWVQVEVCDAAGRVLWQQSSQMNAGAHFIEVPAHVLPLPGVYFWKGRAGAVSGQGKLVRL